MGDGLTLPDFIVRHWPMTRFFGKNPDPPPEDELYERRAQIAQRYIHGRGIEFGALHTPLRVPADATVTYADLAPVESLRVSYSEVGPIKSPDITTDLESMAGILDQGHDFIIANHVLEHVEDPLKALGSIGRVLRPGGIAFVALPDKRFTFDQEREITPLDHLIRDHAEGPDWSLAGHYDEWCRCIDRLDGESRAQKIAVMIQQRANIHFHVWDYPAMMELFCYVAKQDDFGLDIEMSVLNSIEVIWVLRKRC